MFEEDFEDMLRKNLDAVGDKKRFRGLVKDYFPEQAKNINLLLMAYDLGIAEDIGRASEIDNAFAFRFVKQLTDDYGLSRANADWIVSVWCFSYGKVVLRKPCEITLQEEGRPAVVNEKPAATVYNDLFIFEENRDNTGLQIAGFTGKRKDTIVFPNARGSEKVAGIGAGALKGEPVEAAVLTDGIRNIGTSAFEGCTDLHQAVLPFSVSEIGERAFFGCERLKSIALPEQLQIIGNEAFAGTGLKKVDIPKSVYFLGKGAFSDCRELDNPGLHENIREIPEELFFGCIELKQAELPRGLESIGARAFSGCKELEILTIPDSVTRIGEDAFTGCNRKFIIQCSVGSFAESYAREGKIKYQLI